MTRRRRQYRPIRRIHVDELERPPLLPVRATTTTVIAMSILRARSAPPSRWSRWDVQKRRRDAPTSTRRTRPAPIFSFHSQKALARVGQFTQVRQLPHPTLRRHHHPFRRPRRRCCSRWRDDFGGLHLRVRRLQRWQRRKPDWSLSFARVCVACSGVPLPCRCRARCRARRLMMRRRGRRGRGLGLVVVKVFRRRG